MRFAALIVVAACTVGNHRPTTPSPAPDQMPSAVLDKQDPGADTSKNPVLSRSKITYQDPDSPWRGCHWLGCGAGGDAGLLVVACLLALRRRRRSYLPIRNTGET